MHDPVASAPAGPSPPHNTEAAAAHPDPPPRHRSARTAPAAAPAQGHARSGRHAVPPTGTAREAADGAGSHGVQIREGRPAQPANASSHARGYTWLHAMLHTEAGPGPGQGPEPRQGPEPSQGHSQGHSQVARQSTTPMHVQAPSTHELGSQVASATRARPCTRQGLTARS